MEQAGRSSGIVSRHWFVRLSPMVLALAAAFLCNLPAEVGAAPTRPHAHVYLLRGFINVFSLGMDEIAAELRRRGIEASVHNHLAGRTLAEEAAAGYKAGTERPIILVGHSWGASEVVGMAARLGELGVPVKLVVALDPISDLVAAGRVDRMINLHASRSRVTAGPNFHGNLLNIDVTNRPGVGHFTIDKVPAIQSLVLQYVQSALRVDAPAVHPSPNPTQAAVSNPAHEQPRTQ